VKVGVWINEQESAESIHDAPTDTSYSFRCFSKTTFRKNPGLLILLKGAMG
jgi:hypothetical protein